MLAPQGWLVKFAQHMSTHGFAERSIPNYLFNVRLFIEYLGDLGISNLADVSRKVMLDYQLHVSLSLHRGNRLAHVTQRSRIVCLKTFYRFLVKNGAAIYDPTADLELPRVRDQLPPNVLTKREVAKLLAQPAAIRERMTSLVEEFVYKMLTQVLNAADTAPFGIEAILRAGSHDLGAKAGRIEDPAEWTEAKIIERAKSLSGSKGPGGNFDD